MSGLITLAIGTALCTLTILPYFLRYRARERKARARLVHTESTKVVFGSIMHPQIDVLSCIGCGSCVRACPEGDVLELISGRSTLVHPSKCVGHGLCADQCPVGAITLAAAKPGMTADIPVLDDSNETNVPGIFIAGELGGLALIKNAVTQGVRVVEQIAERVGRDGGCLDLAIIGAGPAGLAAGLTAMHLGLRYEIIEQGDIGGTILQYPRRKIVLTSPVNLPLWGKLKLRETTKESLLELWEEIITKTQLAISTGEKVTDIRPCDGHFSVVTSRRQLQALHVVLALGRRGTPRKLGVPGENLSKVAYQLIEAESYQGCQVLVVGGGDSAVEAAIALAAQRGSRVTLSYRQVELSRLKEQNRQRLEENRKRITIELGSQVKEILADRVVLTTHRGPIEIPNQYVFIFAGGEPPYDLLKKVGIRFHSHEMG
ncbi:MAG: NAD(P)-binding domain-containing protein [Acidobacteria bacterium]|nr:NAD(P)-binding domain-containing protein [Acidobacteriota bacterium]